MNTAHTDAYTDRGNRDPRPLFPVSGEDRAQAWDRSAAYHQNAGDSGLAAEYRVYAQLARGAN